MAGCGSDEQHPAKNATLVDSNDREHKAVFQSSPRSPQRLSPQAPRRLGSHPVDENDLSQATHVSATIVDQSKWRLVIDGLVHLPLSISWSQLMLFPKESITAFHEHQGSPIEMNVESSWCTRSVTWAGVPLRFLVDLAKPQAEAEYVWIGGLERRKAAGAMVNRPQKAMLLSKAMMGGALVAYEMNGEMIEMGSGGPARLIVPGWYGTGSTKCLSRISLQDHGLRSPFTTHHNEVDCLYLKK